ncbi:Gar1/Naf1 RNA binding region-domain-containing protein [Melampsora americana]|nr:Gar1/Naf1 RNA binding region-domain-containing protein [Melampsora americana]
MEQNDPITLLVNSNKSIIETNPEVKTSNDISIPSVEINVKDEILKKSDSDLNAETNQSIINNPSTIKTEDEECVKSEPSSPALPEAANGNRQLELSHDIIADQPNPQINVIEKQDLNSLNQAIEEAIRKATSQDSSHDSTFQPHPHAVVNSTASSSSYPMYPIMSTQSARNFAPNPSSPQVITSDSLPNRNNSQTSHRPTPPNLPQDILHIIESDFTNADGTTIDERRETELSRITEELRIKVRLSRYQRARDEMSDSETETESEADEVQIESHLRPTNGERVEIDERCAMESKSEDPDQSVPLNSQPGPPQTFESTHSVSESVQTLSEGLVVSLEQDQRVDSIATPAVSNQAAPSESNSSRVRPTDTSTKNTEKSTGGDKPRRRARKRRPKTRTTVEDDESDSGSGSDVNEIDVAIKIGPTTEHELKDVPAEIIELPFENVPESDLKDIKSFGVIASLIDNIVVVKGDINMGYETVLDEGSMICWQDGTLIGKIFETFGAVTEPHYSIRLPSKLQEMSKNPSENKRFSTDTPVYFVPSQSSFLFTSHIKAQPKGTDASNLYDEEVTNADEIEFSDDEAEAAYARSCRNARKAAAMEKRQQTRPGGNKVQSGTSYLPNPDLLISAGKAMIDKRPSDVLNYNDEDGDGADTDYSVLERPKGLDFNMATPSTSTSASGNNQNGNNSARSNNKRGSDSRTRNNRSQGSSRGKPRGARGSMKGGRNHLSPDKRETHSRPIHNSSPSTSQHPLPSRAEIMPSSSPATWSNPSTPSTFPSTSFSTVVHPLPANPTHLVPQYVPQAFGGFGGTSNLNPASYGFAPSLPNMPRIPSFQSNNNYQYPNFSSQTHQHSYTGQSRFPTMSPNGFAPNGYQPTQSYYPPYTPSPLSTVNVPLQQHEHRSSNSDSLPVQQPLGNGIHYNPRFFPPSNQPSHPHQ